jgi:hypothetical protein
MPDMLARFPISTNIGMISSSKFEAMTKGSLPRVASAALEPLIAHTPAPPISIITMPTGIRRASSTNSAAMPIRPMVDSLI